MQVGLFFSHKLRHARTQLFFSSARVGASAGAEEGEESGLFSCLPLNPPQEKEAGGTPLFYLAVRFPTEKDCCGELNPAQCLQLKSSRSKAAPAGAGGIRMVKFAQCFQLPAASKEMQFAVQKVVMCSPIKSQIRRNGNC